jgi:hypothetical protein
MAQSLDSLGIPYSQTSAYKKAVATEQLKQLAASRAGLSADEKAYFDYQHHDQMTALAATAELDVDVPAGRPDPQWRQDILAQITELNKRLMSLDAGDPEADQIKAEVQDLLAEAARLESAGG